MNILYILGNGFDIAQGMKTKYSDFYKYLIRKKCSPLLKEMRREINTDTKLWSDMEIALGEYTNKFSVPYEYLELHIELIKELCRYLAQEEEKYNPSDTEKTTFKFNILHPEDYLFPYDKELFKRITKGLSSISNQVSFISLNYTNTLIKLLSTTEEMKSFMNINTDNCRNILYLHGYLKSNGIIIGVSDSEQIKNENLRNDPDIGNIIIKEKTNASIGNTSTTHCERMIKNADIIVIYGTSLGDTDNYLWRIIEKNFKTRSNLCIIQHIYDMEFNNALPQERRIYDHKYQDLFLKKINFLNANTQQKERIFCVYNQNFTKPINLEIL
ncbi:MAG: bacteriophage abortive infection AbiH family protein [Bacteroidales bacterium]|nr:bacteriophage abortive infection AbiH family protein [Bacteroidales bacterium]